MTAYRLIPEGSDALSLDHLPWIIGRDGDADLVIDDKRASRRHVEISLEGTWPVLRDLGSSNGTRLNGGAVTGSHRLASGDVIEIGSTRLRFLEEAADVAAAAPGARALRRSSRSRARLWAGLVVLVAGAAIFYAAPGGRPGAVDPSRHQDASAKTDARPEAHREEGEPSVPSVGGPAPADEGTGIALHPTDDGGYGIASDFDICVLEERFVEAAQMLKRLRQDLRPLRQTRLDAAMADAVERIRADVEAAPSQDRVALIRNHLGRFPPQGMAHTELTALLIDARPRSTLAKGETSPGAETTPARAEGALEPRRNAGVRPVAVSGHPTATRPGRESAPFDLAEAVVEKAGAAVLEGESHLSTGRLDEAATAFQAAIETLGGSSRPHRHRLAAERGLRTVAAHKAFRTAIVAAIGGAPGEIGRIPGHPGHSGRLTAVDEGGITFEEGTRLLWRLVPLRTLDAFVNKIPLPSHTLLDAGLVLRAHGAESDRVEDLFARAFTKDDSLKPRIDVLIADVRETPPETGFSLVDGKWYSARELARRDLNATISKSVAAIEGEDMVARRDAINVLLELGDIARSSLHRALLMRKAILKERVAKHPATRALEEIAALRAKLDDARTAALDLIYDTVRYPYPYRPPQASAEAAAAYQKHQPMVTALVAQVRDLWDEKKSYDIPDGFYEIAGEIRGINASIRQAAYGEPTEDPGTWLMHLPPKGSKLTVRTVATGPADRKQLDDSVEVMLANAASPAGATKGEVAQCLITNEYRIMMGRHAVRLYDRLVEASHGHCNDMNRLSFFSHTSPVPEKKTVGDRLRLAGMAAVGGSENIAISSGPERAHNGWIHSSGHHRNLLAAAWRLMGPGNVGRYWCQNFAVRDGNPPTSASADAK